MTSTERRGHTGEGLVRGLGSFDATMLVIGIVIGSGIFLTTGLIARDLPSPALILTVWLLGGLLSLAGCLTFAELGAAWPRSGGLYVYLREAYGPLSGFLFGWLTFLVYQTGALAAVAVGFAEYLSYFVPALGTQRIVTSIEVGGFVLSVSAGQLAACVAIFVAYVRAMGVAAGARQAFAGPMAKPQRMFAVTVAAVYCAVTPGAWQPEFGPDGRGIASFVLALVALGGLWTAARRIHRIARDLREASA